MSSRPRTQAANGNGQPASPAWRPGLAGRPPSAAAWRLPLACSAHLALLESLGQWPAVIAEEHGASSLSVSGGSSSAASSTARSGTVSARNLTWSAAARSSRSARLPAPLCRRIPVSSATAGFGTGQTASIIRRGYRPWPKRSQNRLRSQATLRMDNDPNPAWLRSFVAVRCRAWGGGISSTSLGSLVRAQYRPFRPA
jgi:hypothetical protein